MIIQLEKRQIDYIIIRKKKTMEEKTQQQQLAHYVQLDRIKIDTKIGLHDETCNTKPFSELKFRFMPMIKLYERYRSRVHRNKR